MQNNNNQKPSKLRAFLSSDTFKGLLPVIGLVVIVIVMNILTQGKILTAKRLRLLLSQVYYPMIVATGVFFVMTLGSIDFTEGSTLGLASIVISKLSFYSIPLAIVGGILTGAAIGAINGFFHVKFKLQSFIITICTMYLFRGVCAYMTTESAVPASAAIKALDLNWLKITITVAVLLIAWFLFRFTRIGYDVKAVGAGETAARFSGVKTDRLRGGRRPHGSCGLRQRHQGRLHHGHGRQPARDADPHLPGPRRPADHRRRKGALLQHHRRHTDVHGSQQRPCHDGL